MTLSLYASHINLLPVAFLDASTKAYGAVVHIYQDQETSLVMFISRVAPIKTINLPKLEIMAAVMATD